MKVSWLILYLISSALLYAQDVVINEVLYDPDGADTGYEWVELYNNSDLVINLHDWTIEKAGSSFSVVFSFPNIEIEPYGFILIGEEFVPNIDLTAILAFQNGGSETDGLRLISVDGFYKDTLLYDSPNTNELHDDISDPGENFALDVGGGNSLARKYDEEDSNNCEMDFFEDRKSVV